MSVGDVLEFLRPTLRKAVVFIVFVAAEYAAARYCWYFPGLLRCPPAIHVFLATFGYPGYVAFYVAACLLVYISKLVRESRM